MMSETQETTMTQQPFWVRNIWVIVLSVLLVLGGVFTGTNWASQESTIRKTSDTIVDLKSDIGKQQQLNREKVDENAFEALGITASRLDDDRSTIDSFMDTAFTWDSGATYDRARQSLQTRFKLSEDDRFLAEFMPPAQYNTDGDGNRYYYLDSVGLNSSYEDLRTFDVVKVTGTEYRYAATADLRMTADANVTEDKEGNQVYPEATTRRVLLYVTVDGQGRLSDLDGIPASGVTRTSK